MTTPKNDAADQKKTTRRHVLAGAAVATGAVALSSAARAQEALTPASAPQEAAAEAVAAEGANVDGTKTCQSGWETWVDAATDATLQAWDAALGEAEYRNGVINGPVLEDLEVAVPRGLVKERVYGALVEVGVPIAIARPWAKTAEKVWRRQWRRYKLPATEAFPTFAAVAAPEAPPTEAEPFRLQPEASPKWEDLNATALFNDLAERLGDLLQLPGLPDAIKRWAVDATAPLPAFSEKAQVYGVHGKGPVPAFAPPYVPVGPVVMGDNIAAPGHLMARAAVKPTLVEVAKARAEVGADLEQPK